MNPSQSLSYTSQQPDRIRITTPVQAPAINQPDSLHFSGNAESPKPVRPGEAYFLYISPPQNNERKARVTTHSAHEAESSATKTEKERPLILGLIPLQTGYVVWPIKQSETAALSISPKSILLKKPQIVDKPIGIGPDAALLWKRHTKNYEIPLPPVTESNGNTHGQWAVIFPAGKEQPPQYFIFNFSPRPEGGTNIFEKTAGAEMPLGYMEPNKGMWRMLFGETTIRQNDKIIGKVSHKSHKTDILVEQPNSLLPIGQPYLLTSDGTLWEPRIFPWLQPKHAVGRIIALPETDPRLLAAAALLFPQ